MPEYVVRWVNPVTRIPRELRFPTREEAEKYVQGRERKYGSFKGYVRPQVESS